MPVSPIASIHAVVGSGVGTMKVCLTDESLPAEK
jgi:hypothetical protein